MEDGQCAHCGVADSDAGGVAVLVEFGVDFPALPGRGGPDEVDDHLVAGQRPATPVHRDMTEEPVLDFVPLAGARR